MSIAEKLTTVAENQQKVYDAGYEAGLASGDGGDTDAAYKEGLEAGKQAEYDRFWDMYQQNGKREEYSYAFAGHAWTDELIQPKYLPIGTNLVGAFAYNGNITKTPPMRCGEGRNWSSTFTQCKNLVEFGEITGTIGTSISLSASDKLKPESVIMLIEHLKDYSNTEKAYTYKVTFHETAWANLEAHSTAPDGGTWREFVNKKGWNT